jgi:hypothetical protein
MPARAGYRPAVGLAAGQTLPARTNLSVLCLCNESQTSPSNPAGSSFFEDRLKASISLKVPVAIVVALNPVAGGGDLPLVEMAATMMAALNKTTHVSLLPILSPPFFPFSFGSFGIAEWRRADTIRHFGRRRQRARSGLMAVPLFTVECRDLP